MSSETATDRDEDPTPSHDKAPSPEDGFDPAGVHIILTKEDKPAVVLREVAVPVSPVGACLHKKVGPPKALDDSPFNHELVMELIDLFRTEFTSSTKEDGVTELMNGRLLKQEFFKFSKNLNSTMRLV